MLTSPSPAKGGRGNRESWLQITDNHVEPTLVAPHLLRGLAQQWMETPQ